MKLLNLIRLENKILKTLLKKHYAETMKLFEMSTFFVIFKEYLISAFTSFLLSFIIEYINYKLMEIIAVIHKPRGQLRGRGLAK